MNILVIGKAPPIQGGVSLRTFWFCVEAARNGVSVDLVTNADDVEPGYRQFFLEEDFERFGRLVDDSGLTIHNVTSVGTYHQVPRSDCYLSRLFGAGSRVLGGKDVDLILGWYFEPYGMTAALLGHSFNKPVALIHAGSDLGRLSNHPDLFESYHWMLGSARRVYTRLTSEPLLLEKYGTLLGPGKLVRQPLLGLPAFFTAEANALDMRRYTELAEELHRHTPVSVEIREQLKALNIKPFNTSLPTIGIYGKSGPSKGRPELLEALDSLAKEGLEFNFLSATGGTPAGLRRFYRRLLSSPPLAQRSWALPFLPPWRVPEFIKACIAVCFLENDFPIQIHRPCIPLEVLSVGSCLICTEDKVRDLPFRESLVGGINFIPVKDVKDVSELKSSIRAIIKDPKKASIIGAHGRVLAEWLNSRTQGVSTFINSLAEIC